ncbi:MAG: hypothetical protein J6A88_01140 [Oscillospiraceae bacterium]|nr:hypothetical protein [Oscillospiraceae bacterium]
MKMKWKAIVTVFLLLCVACMAGCSGDKNPYDLNDQQNFTVSIKYDANGGLFTTNTSIIVDSYNISQLPSSNGDTQLALRSPDDPSRGNDAFAPVNNGYFLAGWYTGRTEQDGKILYSGRWDFANDRLTVAINGDYSAAEPVLTLYAAWVPLFEIEFYDRTTGDLLDTLQYDPTITDEIVVPAWSTETGAIEMYDFPEKKGYTFLGAYYDAAGTNPVNTEFVQNLGSVDLTTGSGINTTTKLYVDWMEGEWFHIYNVDQLLDNASLTGNYILHADLDFTDKIWPTVWMYGNFTGSIQGNGHTIRNVNVIQTNNSKTNAGMFGQLTETAAISNLTFENVTFTIKSGTRMMGTNYGLLAGTISEKATLTDVRIVGGVLQIDSSCYFGVEDYSIGLVCGMGDAGAVTGDVTCKAVGDAPESLWIQVSGNSVTVEFVEQPEADETTE